MCIYIHIPHFNSDGGKCSAHVENKKCGKMFLNLKRKEPFRRD